jgi:hypothetical protein
MPLAKQPERPRTSPLLSTRLSSRKYHSWKVFLENSSWSIDFRSLGLHFIQCTSTGRPSSTD